MIAPAEPDIAVTKIVDRFRVLDELCQRLPVFAEQRRGFFQPGYELHVGRGDRLQRMFDEFQPRQRAGRNRLVGIDDKRIGDRDRGLELCAHLLGAEFDGLQFRSAALLAMSSSL